MKKPSDEEVERFIELNGMNNQSLLGIKTGLDVTWMDSVSPTEVQWLWPGRIPAGRLTVLAGDPGCGKSHLSIDIAARISRAKDWPDGTEACERGSVLLLGAEDDLSDTVRPRIDAANGDPERIGAIDMVRHDDGRQHMFCLDQDIAHLETLVREIGDVRMIIVDPISAYMGRSDSHNNAEVRGVLLPLQHLASRHNLAVLAITHLSKSDRSAMYRAMGSLAFVAVARCAWFCIKDPDDDEKRLFMPLKNNIAPDRSGLQYSIRPATYNEKIACVSWGDVVDRNLDELMSANGAGGLSVKNASKWLREKLADGAQSVSQLKTDAEEEDFSWATIKRAKKSLAIKSSKSGLDSGWLWELE